MNPFEELNVHDDEDDFTQVPVTQKQPKKSKYSFM